MVNKETILNRLAEHGEELRKRFAVRSLAIFGSVSRNEVSEESDVDMLVEFEQRADFDRFMDLKFYLEDLFEVRVDLVTRKALRPCLQRAIE